MRSTVDTGNAIRFRRLRHATTAACLVAILTYTATSFAQTTTPDASAGPTNELAEVTVTAQRRSENIQNVPVTVTALSRDQLASAGIEKVEDLQQADPSLSVSAQSGAVIPFIRGIGNLASQTPGNESSVPIYIDDAYYSRLFVPYLSFADNIERVEVLEGPQGTLFGRNATGGLINIITRDPDQTPEFNTRIGYGSQQTWKGQMYLSEPITDTLAADFSVIGQKMGQGFGTNLYDGTRAYYRDFFTLRTKWVWTPTDTTKVRLSGVYVYDNSSIGTVQGGLLAGYTRGLPPNFTQQYIPPSGFYDINVNYDTERHHRGGATTLRIDQELGFADFTSISFYRNSHEPWTSEGDHTNIAWLQYNLNVEDSEYTEELQLKSRESSPIEWIGGLYFLDAHAAYDPTSIFGESINESGLESVNYIGKQTIESKAAFGQTTFPIVNDQTKGTLGVRYTIDDVRGVGESYGYAPDSDQSISLAPNYKDDARFEKITYRAALDHHFTDQIMGYTSYSRGYKSGVFNLLPLDSPPVPPEVLDAYELGLKTTLLGGILRLDLAAFWNNIEHIQTNVVEAINGVAIVELASAQKARTRGIEFSGDALLTTGLTMRFSGQYIDAKFIDFPNAPVNTPIFTAPYGLVPSVGNASGFRLPQVPQIKFNLGFDYRTETRPGAWTTGVNISYRSSFPWEADNVVWAPALTLVNANVKFEPASVPHMDIRLWSKNLTNRKYYDNVLSQTGPAGYLASPAEGLTFGVEVGYKF